MDRLDSLASQLSQITMYDIKSYYNQAKNVVLNISEMEAKVREATNDEPWGASSTLMQEIATGTFNFQNFNEIMPCVYARFMEKEARQWREIYKALQLLEYLIKHGSERVIDDARSHISTIKMLRNFHYIDDKGKDEGINVRNRSRELVELLSDVEKIRAERRKAKMNKHKYTGTGNDGTSFSSGGSRYGGFGNEGGLGGGFSGGFRNSSGSYGQEYSGGGYSGGSGGSSGGFRDETSRQGFQEYDAGDDESTAPVRRSTSVSQTASPRRANTAGSAAPAPPPQKSKEPEVDLLGGFGDDEVSALPATNKALPNLTAPGPAVSLDDDDEFADFQAAPTSPAPTSAPPPPTTGNKLSLMDMLNSGPTTTARAPMASAPVTPSANNNLFSMLSPSNTQTQQKPAYGGAASPPTMGMGMTASPPPMGMGMGGAMRATSVVAPIRSTSTPVAPAVKPSGDFGDLWSMSLGSGKTSKPATGPSKSIKDLEKEKAQAGIWGAQKSSSAMGGANSGFGNFGGSFGSSGSASSSGGGGDDLLL